MAEGAAQIVNDEGRAVQRINRIGREIGRVAEQQLRQAVTGLQSAFISIDEVLRKVH